ncbi:MAG TPA: hypothetical protein VGF45_16880 [Polyangia bacterium]
MTTTMTTTVTFTKHLASTVTALASTVVLLVAAPGAAQAQELIPITNVTVTPARPTKSDVGRLRKLLALEGTSDQDIEARHPVYIVKVFARFQPGPAKVALSIGETTFPVFGTFGQGVFVRVYEAEKLRALAGQPVKLARLSPKGEAPTADPASLPKLPALAAAGAMTTMAAPAPKTVDEVLKSNN